MLANHYIVGCLSLSILLVLRSASTPLLTNAEDRGHS